MKDPNQKTPLPVKGSLGKVMGPQDFSGQDSGYPSGSPEEEVSKNQDSGTAGLNSQYLPEFSNLGRVSNDTVYRANDPKLHTDASYRPGDGRDDGTPPVPYRMWPGPHSRGT